MLRLPAKGQPLSGCQIEGVDLMLLLLNPEFMAVDVEEDRLR
ncbi:hypothetical protein EV129_1067 [Rhizobium azibense]|uniref:Uncharacterized protein n=1 Tax=Rhizobium azibense TaxID=1136135 RepID=A0A4R3RYV2_9HYPH|nr:MULTISPECIES: hypothetical protein [Rhizobium]TCU37046.1 hypothetical protein EV129_1067 [Rhizobium azibense]